jgi:hypothetical protein
MSSLDVAVDWYLRQHNLAVFPCANKKPLIAGGFHKATRDKQQVIEWFTKVPEAQIGVVCGAINHITPVDVDGPRGAEWYAAKKWPETFTVETSPGRFQYWFRQPEGVITKPSAGVIAPEIDIRGDGSYVIGPFSVHHRTKTMYTPLTFAVRSNGFLWADAPDELLRLVERKETVRSQLEGDVIPKGRRHQTMLSLAGGLRARGMSAEAIFASLQTVNAQNCKPPLEESELRRLADYTATKQPGFRNQRPMNPCAEVEIQCFRDICMEKINWLWRHRIALGKLNLFVGDPEKGKSLVSIDLAARTSKGTKFPDGESCDPGDVLIVSCEDDASDTVKPRLLHACAELSRVHRIKGVKVTLGDGNTGQSFFNLERDLEKLEQALENFPKIKLIIIDPIAAFMGKVDSWKDTEVRAVLGPFADFAGKRKIAIVGIMHLRKADATAILRVSGSIGFVAAARIVWGFGPDPDNPERHIMVAVKNNLGPKAEPLAFKIIGSPADPEVGVIEWLKDKVTFRPDEVLDNSPRRNRRDQKKGQAEEWLDDLLKDGPMPQPHIKAEASRAGFSWATIRRAADDLGVIRKKTSFGGGWMWSLPEDAQIHTEDVQV